MTHPENRKTLFISALSSLATAKSDALRRLDGERFHVDSSGFRMIPNAPFAYWLTPGLRSVFTRYPKISENYDAKQGLATADDFRFLRLWWEVKSQYLGFTAEDTMQEKGWVHFAKGGNFSKYYADLHLVLNWISDGAILKVWAGSLYNGSHWSRIIKNVSYYFRPGVTWPRRSQKGLSIRVLPEGCIFSDKGTSMFSDKSPPSISILSSSTFSELVKAQMTFGSFEAGVIQNSPFPSSNDDEIGRQAFHKVRRLDTATENSHAFCLPWLIQFAGETLSERFMDYQAFVTHSESELARLQQEIDELAFDLYELSEEDRVLIRAGPRATAATITEPGGDELDAEAAEAEEAENEDEEAAGADLATLSHALLSWCVGVAFGRWDVRMALDPTLIPELQGPFERLPVVAPAGLVGVDGYPADGGQVAPEAWLRARPNVITLPEGEWANTSDYPLSVAWDGILVSDQGGPRDLSTRVRAVLRQVFGNRVETIEDELLEAVRSGERRPADLEEYLNPRSFFATHLKGYSRSRRKAPIYWPLMHPNAPGFVVWLYAPALTAQSLPRVLTDVVLPRLDSARAEVGRLQSERASNDNAKTARGLEQAEDFARGIQALAEELRRVVDAGYEPRPDDGTLLSASPLHTVFPWKDLAPAFRAVQAGKYPWSHVHTQWAAEGGSE